MNCVKGAKGVPGPAGNWGYFRMLLWKLTWNTPLKYFFIWVYGCYKEED